VKKYIFGGIGFFFLASFCFIAFGLQAVPQNYLHPNSENGVIDLTGVDFESEIVMIYPGRFIHYPLQLLEPGEVGAAGDESVVPYGTYRITLLLPVGDVYAASQTANDMALRTMADGKIIGSWGTVGTTMEESYAMAGTLLSAFSVTTPESELAYQYSGFVRHYRPPSVYLGSVEQIAAQQQRLALRDMLFAGCMLTAMLLFLGMYIFFGRKRQYLFFSLCCLGLMVNIITRGVMLATLLWPLGSVAVARIEYLSNNLTALMFFCYTDSVFKGVFHKAAYRIGTIFIGLSTTCILFLHPYAFTQMRVIFTAIIAAMCLYCCLMLVIRIRKPLPEQALLLISVLLLVVVVLLEQFVLRWVLPYRLGNGFPTSCAMVGAVFLNMIALSFYAMRAEWERDEARQRQRELDENNRILDRLGRMKTEFLANMSHEMKTPLTVISANAQLSKELLRRGEPEHEIVQNLDVIHKEAKRLARMASETLTLSNMRESRIGFSSVDMRTLLEKTAEVYRSSLEKQGNVLAVNLPGAIPPIYGSADQLAQVMLNLLSNANAHTHGGQITVSAATEDGSISVTVSDNGAGISQNLLPDVFARYHTGTDGGAGLGLAICKDIIDRHGGGIHIESEQSAGTTVCFSLPVWEEGQADERQVDTADRG